MAATIQTIEKPKRARALDTSGNNNHGQIYSGRALEFDGASDYLDAGVTAATLGITNNVTVACWINSADLAASDNLFPWNFYQSTSNGFGVKFSSSTFKIINDIDNADTNLYATTLELNTWYRVIVVLDNLEAKLYINGVLSGSGTSIADGLDSYTSNIYIGNRKGSGGTGYYEGMLSDFQVWDTAWTADDVTYDYLNPEQLVLNRGGTSLTESNLKLWYPMNDGHRGQQSYILDASNTGLGDDIVTNGGFDSDTGWTKGTGWTISGGQAHCDGSQTGNSSLVQNSSRIIGQTYKVTYTISNYVAGTVNAHIGGNNVGNQSGNGDYEHYIIAGSDNDDINMYASSAFNATIDNLVVKPVNQKNHATTVFHGDELITNGTMEADSNWADYNSVNANVRSSTQAHSGTYSRKFTVDGSSQGIQSDTFTTVTGRTYLLSFEIYPDDATTARIAIRRGDNSDWADDTSFSGLTQDAWNTKTVTYTESAGGSGAYLVVHGHGNTSGDFYVDDVSIKEVGTASGWTDADQQLDIPQTALQSYNQLAWFSGINDSHLTHIQLNGDITKNVHNSNVSYSAWVKRNVTNAQHIIFGDDGTSVQKLIRLEVAGTISIESNNNDNTVIATLAANDTNWHHYVVTCDSGTTKFYQDGKLLTNTNANVMDDALTIRRLGGGTGKGLEGSMTEASIWDATLTQAEVNELYNDGKALDALTHSNSNLFAYWRNNGFSKWEDLKGSKDGTPTNFAEIMLITAGADATRDSQGFLMNRQRTTNSLNLFTNTIADGVGNGDRAVVPGRIDLGTSDFSVSFWLYISQSFDNQWVVAQYVDDNNRFYVRSTGNNMHIYAKSGGNTVLADTDSTNMTATHLDKWVHVVVAVDRSDEIKWYLNGALSSTGTVDGSGDENSGQESRTLSFNADTTIGWFAHPSFDDHHFNGEIDDLCIYSKYLTAAEVKRNYNAGKRSHR